MDDPKYNSEILVRDAQRAIAACYYSDNNPFIPSVAEYGFHHLS